MSRSKYIVGPLQSSTMGVEGAVVFPEYCDHRLMAQNTIVGGPEGVMSAGFVYTSLNPETGDVSVSLEGASVSLKKAADPAHTNMVRRALGLESI